MTRLPPLLSNRRPLTSRERSMLALCAVSVLLFLAAKFLVLPWVDGYRQAKSDIPRLKTLYEKRVLSARGGTALESALEEAEEALSEAEEKLVPGESPAEAGAAMQVMAKSWVTHAKTKLSSIRMTAPEKRGPYVEIGVQLDFQTTTEGLMDALSKVSLEKRALRVRRLAVSSSMYNPQAAKSQEVLVVSMSVSGLADVDQSVLPQEGGPR